MMLLWYAGVGATVVVALLVALVYLTAGKHTPDARTLMRWAAGLWVFNLLLDVLILYFAHPAFTGPYGGWQWLLWPIFATGLLAFFGGGVRWIKNALDAFTLAMNRPAAPVPSASAAVAEPRTTHPWRSAVRGPRSGRAAGTAMLALVLVIATLVNGLITVSTTWFSDNANALAGLSHIVVEPKTQSLPTTSVDSLELVTRGIAANLGAQALLADGQPLGETYHADAGSYTLQSVAGHLYWIAPLVNNNVFANAGQWTSPGYIVVDAQDPTVPPRIRTGYALRYLPLGVLNHELVRHTYLSGYTDGNLDEVIFLVDDQWHPYFSVSEMRPTRGFSGETLARELLVNPQTGAITSYAPTQVPAWVDRVLPGGQVGTYLTWWGAGTTATAAGLVPARPIVPYNTVPQLLYNTPATATWLSIMTPKVSLPANPSQQERASTPALGVMLYDTRQMTGQYYPMTGLSVPDAAALAMAESPQNPLSLNVSLVQLCEIFGEPTYVATLTQTAQYGDSFEGVALVDALHVNKMNAILRPTKDEALAAYAQWLVAHGATSGVPSGKPTRVTGTLTRVAPATENGSTVYYLTLAGGSEIYRASVSLSPQLPLTRPGDRIEASYLDIGLSTVTLTSFDDLSLTQDTP